MSDDFHFTSPVVMAVIGTILLLALIIIVEVKEYAGRMRDRRLDELNRNSIVT